MQVTISQSNYTFLDVSTWLDRLGRTYDNEIDDDDDVPFSHQPHYSDGTYDANELWSDERIDSMVQSVAIEATDDDGVTWRTVLADDVCRLLRTMRDEYEIMLSRGDK